MNIFESDARIAAKALLYTPDGSRVLVHGGGANALTLPGGGLQSGETVLQALNRELDEELGIVVPDADIVYRGYISGPVTNKNGDAFMAHWELFEAQLADVKEMPTVVTSSEQNVQLGQMACTAIELFPPRAVR